LTEKRMRVGVHVGHWERSPVDLTALAQEAERAGLDSVWTSEAWGSDGLVLLTWIAAHTRHIAVGTGILQIPARTPANVAMAAITLDHLTGGRLRLGLGTSGPQVAEGWYGEPFERPLERSDEYIRIIKAILQRKDPVRFEGAHYRLPAAGGTGLGKPLKAEVVPLRADLPIYLAAMGPRNTSLAARVADGWLPLFYSPENRGIFEDALTRGFASGGRSREHFDISPVVPVAIGDDLDECRNALRATIARYIGGMGTRGANFYNSLVRRYGYEEVAEKVQALFLDGQKPEAVASVPDALVDELSLTGPVERVRERLEVWAGAGVTTLLGRVRDVETVRLLAQAAVRHLA
jgi:F420-dependent oxidoreductase-like protein